MTPLTVFLIVALFTSLAVTGYFYAQWVEAKNDLRRARQENERFPNRLDAAQEALLRANSIIKDQGNLISSLKALLREAIQLAEDALKENTDLKAEVKYFRESSATLKPLFEASAEATASAPSDAPAPNA